MNDASKTLAQQPSKSTNKIVDSRYKNGKERFWSKINKEGPIPDQAKYPGLDRCWVWTAGTYGKNSEYGCFCFRGRPMLAHRLSYMIAFGTIQNGLHVLHHCDNPPCCNPHHLFIGTQQDNVADAVSKDRQSRGIKHSMPGEQNKIHKLTNNLVREIRRKYEDGGTSHRKLGLKYCVSGNTIRGIVNGIAWKHLL